MPLAHERTLQLRSASRHAVLWCRTECRPGSTLGGECFDNADLEGPQSCSQAQARLLPLSTRLATTPDAIAQSSLSHTVAAWDTGPPWRCFPTGEQAHPAAAGALAVEEWPSCFALRCTVSRDAWAGVDENKACADGPGC